MQVRKIQWIIIIAKDWLLLKEFYVNKLGMQLVREVPEDGFAQLQIGGQFFAIYQKDKISNVLPDKLFTSDFSSSKTIFSLNQSENIQEDYEALVSAGVEFIQPPTKQAWGQTTAYFKDPEGNLWEIQKWGK